MTMDDYQQPPPTDPSPPGRWLTPGVVGVGAASLFSDTGHEMVTSLLPTFLTATLGAGPATLGAIDGVADAFTGLSKLAGGPLAADPMRRTRLAAGGYLGTAAATALIGLATAVWQVALLRGVAWISRGIRSPGRDMVLTSLSTKDTYGRAFGIERAGDNAGAIIGPLLASLLVGLIGVRHAILLAFIPGILAAVTQAAGDLVATVVAGVLWSAVSPAVAFGYAAAWMVASVVASSRFTMRRAHHQGTRPS